MTLRDRVIKRLKTTGWCQNILEDDEGRNCIMGAVNREARNAPEYEKFVLRLFELTGSPPTVWNDTPGRTFEEVLELLEQKY